MIGFWAWEEEPWWPSPETLVDPTWDRATREAIASHLDRGKREMVYGGFSECRICGCPNGTADFTDGVYIWPQGLAHYVREHHVRLPEQFVTHALERRGRHKAWHPDHGVQSGALRILLNAPPEDPMELLLLELQVEFKDPKWWMGFANKA